MNNKQVLSALLTAIMVLSIATSMAAATDAGGCSMDSNPEVQFTNDPLSNRIDDLLAEDKSVFLFFYADWCPYCHQETPIIDQLEAEYAGEVAFIRINVTARPDHAEEFGVSALPTMFVTSGKNEEGYVKQEISGFTEKARLREIIDLEIGQSEQTVIGDVDEDEIPDDANYNSSIDKGKANSNVLSSLSSGIAYAGNYELLIIAPDEFIDELKPLKDFKDATGRPTILLSLSEIYSNPSCSGIDEPEKIKKCIAHYEKSYSIQFVMLVGDCDKFPVRYCSRDETEPRTYTPCDLYYADLYKSDGSFDNWDGNGNGVYAELRFTSANNNIDNVNWYPDIAVARVPASSITEVTTYVEKIISYEFNAYNSLWFKKALLVTGGWGNDEEIQDYIATNYLSGFSIIKHYYGTFKIIYPIDPNDIPGSMDKRAEPMATYINQGVGFINYIGHGSTDDFCWVFDKRHVASLSNKDTLPVVFSGGCDTGGFAPNPPWQDYTDTSNTFHYSHAPSGVTAPPMAIQPGKTEPHNCDREAHPENWLVYRDIGAIGFIGPVGTGNPTYTEIMDKNFFKTYKDGYRTFGDMWYYMVEPYLLQLFDAQGNIKHTNFWHRNATWNMLIRFMALGDPSLAVGGLHDKKITITHDTTLYPTTYNTPEGILIDASNVVLDCKGAIINGTGWGNGIHIPDGINNVTIKNCNIKNYQYGIEVGSNSNTIISNNIYSNEYGVYLLSGVNNKIIGNDIYSNDYGISLINADSNEIRYNTIKNNDADGVYLDMYSSDNNLISNTICSNTGKDISNNVNYGGPNYGNENTCSNVYKWNDDGAIGCTYLCEHTPTLYYCDSCSDCTNKINTAPPGSVIKLTKNIINHHGTCIEWKVDGKTFDCQNHTIDGDDSTGSSIEQTYHAGIDMSFGPEGNTIKNCVISDFEYGIAIRSSSLFGNASYYNNIINNVLYSNVRDGINIFSSSGIADDFSIIKNNVVINNGRNGITISSSDKNLIDSNIVCSNTKSDFFLSYSYDNSGINNYCDTPDGWNDAGETGCSKSCSKAPVSCAPGEVIPYDDMEITSDTKLCRGFYNIQDSDDRGVIIIKSDNVVLDCNGATINGDGSGIGIYNNEFDNIILKNCNIKNYEFGIGTVYSSYNTITSNNISNNSYGIDMEYSSNNTLNSNNIHSNSLYGIYMVYSSDNALTSNNICSNNLFANTNGIGIVDSSSNTLICNNINDNSLTGIDISSNSNFNTLNNNKIKNNGYGVSLTDSNNVELNANIICENTISDLYLDDSYDNSGNNNYCDNPDGWNDTGTTGCTNPCAAAPTCAPDEVIPYDDLVVTKDTKLCHGFYNISDLGGWGVIYVESSGVVLDCNGATLNGTGFGRGIYAGDVRYATIKNCNIQNYGIGIDTHSEYSTITNNNLNSNDNGLVLWQATGNTITKNHINSNAVHGIDLHGNSDLNTIGNNLIENNGKGVWFASDSNENNLSSNIICSNPIDIKDDDENFGDENTCDMPGGWNDDGTTGCTYQCPKCVTPTDDLYINSDTTLCPGFYNISNSGADGVIIINAPNVVLDCNGATLNGAGSGSGIFNPGFDNVTIRNGNVLNYETGIHLFESDNSVISNNVVSYSNNQGISIEGSQYCDVYDNKVSFSGDRGITFGGGGNNAAYNNTVHNNSAYGAIEAIHSDNNEIYKNIAYFNQWGIATNHGSNNLIRDNTIYENELGVHLDWPSTNNRVLNNEISSNGEGVRTNHNSSGNLISGNLVFSNDDAGMHIETDDNTLTGNTANNNRVGLYLGVNSSGNVVSGNIFCSNLIYDIRDEGGNSGDDNTCDLTGNWNDSETTGCTHSCPPSEGSKGDLNGDGTITTADAAIALQLAASGEWCAEADVDCDRQVTSLDALMILQAAAGNIELQGCESS
ncbi:MAG: right-handed parallel beta-helix repeat-containing protein [Candidatus Methanogasteraceae archaeon]